MTVIILSPGQQVTLDLAGQFVFLESAIGPVNFAAVFADRSESAIVLNPRDQARWEKRFIGLRITNQHSAGQTITIKCSDAQYFPKQDGGAVHISGQDSPLDVVLSAPSPVPVAFPGAVTVENEGGFGVVLVPGSAVTAPPEIVPGLAGTAIPANPSRLALILKVDPDNAGLVWLSSAAGQGLPLAAGDPPLTLNTDAAVALLGTNATDKVYLMEIIE